MTTTIDLPQDLEARVRVLKTELRAARGRLRVQRDRTAFAIVRQQLAPASRAVR